MDLLTELVSCVDNATLSLSTPTTRNANIHTVQYPSVQYIWVVYS